MIQVIKYLRKGIKKYSEDIAYIIVVGIPFLVLSIWLGGFMKNANLY